jgi:methionyl-tRNA formyltransferase
MRAVLIGAVESTRIALRVLSAAADWTISALVTLPPELAARHSDYVDMAGDASAAGARLIHAADGNSPQVIAQIEAARPDLLVVIGWSQLCKQELMNTAPQGAIGYHPAPLPHLRGRGVIPWTILLEQPITAGTLFWIDKGVDSGPILAQRFFHVARDETAESLYARHLDVLEAMLGEVAPALAAGTAPRIAQDERYASWTAKRTPEDGRIDWQRPAAEIERLIRAVGRPYPGAFTTVGGERLVIWKAERWDGAERYAAAPGQVIVRQDGGFVVRCGDGQGVRVTEWQRPSGRPPLLHGRLGEG